MASDEKKEPLGELPGEPLRELPGEPPGEPLREPPPPTIYVISDSLGDSAATLAAAASRQFSQIPCIVHRIPMVTTFEQIAGFIEVSLKEDLDGNGIVLLYTLANDELRFQLENYIRDKPVFAVDLFGPLLGAISQVTGRSPKGEPGLYRRLSEGYYRRIQAMGFAVEHDDGRNTGQLGDADLVLIGVSRTSKTPLSVYLATFGYRVANIPLALGVEPPPELFEVERQRIFGLTSNAELLSQIRARHLGNASEVAASYADIDSVQEDLDSARQFMRALGCIVVHTDSRSIEETAQEILRYYNLAYPLHEMPY
ncbi:MAG: kinase/pyrophosphorylase [Coriobacteriia bacterium]|nr:kinase/pyrophosphorylase [Coriobacteriia bacterium]